MADIEKSIIASIEKMKRWHDEIYMLREILLSCGLEEAVKWGAPVYMHNGKNICGIMGFKDHAALWFFQGVFLKDESKVLINANEESTKGLRQWRFTDHKQIKPALIKKYIKEAIQVSESDKKIERTASVPLIIPEILVKKMKKTAGLKTAFASLTPGKQKDYIQYITQAKQEKTQESRVEKITPLILSGKGLNDKYIK